MRWTAYSGAGGARAQCMFPLPWSHSSRRPNIPRIMGDGIGVWTSGYNRARSYRTPHMDRIANEGASDRLLRQQPHRGARPRFDAPGQSSMPHRAFESGSAGGQRGLFGQGPDLAELLKPAGYMTGQFGKNHLCDLQ